MAWDKQGPLFNLAVNLVMTIHLLLCLPFYSDWKLLEAVDSSAAPT